MGIKRDKYDVAFSRFIKLLSGGYCKRCHSYVGVNSRGLHAAHCFSRQRQSVRLYKKNSTALCHGCHRYLDRAENRGKKMEFFQSILTQSEWAELVRMSDMTSKDLKIDKEEIYKKLKEDIKLLEA